MSEKMEVDLSLDDIIRRHRGKFSNFRNRSGRGVGRGRRGRGATRGFRAGQVTDTRYRINATSPRGFFKPKNRPTFLTTNRIRQRAGASNVASGPSKLVISNLHYGVSDSDIKELFADFGHVRKAVVHYDQSGRSLGTADVLFENRSDAIRALKKYNGVPLDGREMKIQITSSFMPRQDNFAESFGRRGTTVRGSFAGRRGRGRGRGRGRA